MNPSGFRKWLALGTGVAIEVGASDLSVVGVRVRPTGIRVLGSLMIPRFRERPAAEWGEIYAGFLKKLGLSHLAAQVLLPREAVIVRQIPVPGVANKDLSAALRFQIDSLHPYPEEEAAFDWARIGKTASVLVGIARRDEIEHYSALFAEAGVKISSFTFSAASFYSSAHLLGAPPAGGFLALGGVEGEWEAYGESPARPIFSVRLDAPFEQARALATSELRLPPETEPLALQDVLPKPEAVPEDYDAAACAAVYAAAVAGACPWLALSTNLLPAAQRKTSSRIIYIPTAVLASLVVLMAIVLAGYSNYEDKRYLVKLQEQIRIVQPQARRAAALNREIANTRNRSLALDNFRGHLKDDMAAINDLSDLVAPPAWLNSLQLTRDSVSISGEAERAEALLKLLDSSKQFRRSEFTLPISRSAGGENFSIHSVREGVSP